MSKTSRRANPTAARNDGPLSVTLGEALGEAKVAEVQAVVDGPAATKRESFVSEVVFGTIAMARLAARAAVRRVRGVFARSR
ncbi:MAG TPA: hypothetical protein VGF99_05500 [Myxococcota bacterium]